MKEQKTTLSDWTRIVIETDEKDPVTIADITADSTDIRDGYRVRFTPLYNQCSVSRGGNGSLP